MTSAVPTPNPSVDVVSTSPADTLAVGRRLAGLLRPGDVVLLAGRLGAGKTLLASGIGEGLGVEEPVISPSFVLVRSYEGFVPLHHADVYRLGSTAEFDDLDLLSSANDGVLLIEWGDVVASVVPPDHLLVEINIVDEQQRVLHFTPHGAWLQRSLREIAE